MLILDFKDKLRIVAKRKKIKVPQIADKLGVELNSFRNNLNSNCIKESQLNSIGDIFDCKIFIRFKDKEDIKNRNKYYDIYKKISYDDICFKITKPMFYNISNDKFFYNRIKHGDLLLKDIISIGNELGYCTDIVFKFEDGSEL